MSSGTKETIVIVGFGWVGQANALALRLMGHQVFFYDPAQTSRHYLEHIQIYEEIPQISHVLEKDSSETVYVVCVGDRVNDDGVQDLQNINKALNSIRETEGIVVLRSTILPHKLRDLKFDIYLPEFLHEKFAVKECMHPFYFVVGKRDHTIKEPFFLKDWRSASLKSIDCSPEEASHIKYLSNIWNALRIAFVNEYGNSIIEPKTSEEVGKIDNVVRFIFEDKPYLKYGRSFGGHCLPKDIRAYTRWCKDSGKQAHLFEGVILSNDFHKTKERQYNHLSEWFSKWTKPDISGWVALEYLGKALKRKITKMFS